MDIRRSYWLITTAISLCLGLVIGCIALAAFGPAQPGQIFFPVQLWSENLHLRLIRDRNGKLEQQLKLANRRLSNLHQTAGTVYEPMAARRLTAAIEEAGAEVLSQEWDERQDVRLRFIQFSQDAQATISHLPLFARYPLTYKRLQDRLDDLITLMSQTNQRKQITLTPTATPFHEAALITPTPSSPQNNRISIQDDVFPVVSDFQEFDPHTPGGRCNRCHNFKTDCLLCHQKSMPNHHFELECMVCHDFDDWHTIELDHIGSELFICSDCHRDDSPAGHYEGECSTCHKVTSWLPGNIAHKVIDRYPCLQCHEYEMPPGHYPVTCTICHELFRWIPAHVDHSDPALSDCMVCHLSVQPANHYNAQCSFCHAPGNWKLVRFDHQAIGAVNCRSCHSGDAPGNHYDAQCSNCHKTNAWLPANFNHGAVNTSQCTNCHSKDGHYNINCSYCHNTRSWGSVDFNHGIVNATDCLNCHSDDAPNDHFSGQCSICHNTNGWSSADFDHKEYGATDCIDCHSDDAPEDHYDEQCSQCHSTNSWEFDHDRVNRCNMCHEPGRKRDD